MKKSDILSADDLILFALTVSVVYISQKIIKKPLGNIWQQSGFKEWLTFTYFINKGTAPSAKTGFAVSLGK